MKKVLLGILCLFMIFPIINAQEANYVTIDKVIEELPKTNVFQMISQNEEANVRIAKNETDHTIDFYMNEELFAKISYTSEYIEYVNNNEITMEEAEKQFSEMFFIGATMEAVLRACGYEDKTLSSDDSTNYNEQFYNTYGLLTTSEKYNITEDGHTSSGDFIRHFKISLDKNKIDKLMSEYASNSTTPDLKNLRTSLKVKSSDKGSVKLGVKVLDDSGENFTFFCNIYRSDSENGTYVKLNDEEFACSSKETTYTDKNVESGKTYYYKASVSGSTVDSPSISVKTSSDVAVKNPKTGVDNQLFYLLYATLAAILVITYLSKQKGINF